MSRSKAGPILALLLALLWPGAVSAQVQYRSTSSNTSSTTSMTISSPTVNASWEDRLMMVGISVRGTRAVTSVVRGSETFELVSSTSRGSGDTRIATYVYRLVNPASGSTNISVSMSGSGNAVGGAVVFSGVDQDDPTFGAADDIGSTTSGSVTISDITIDDMVFATVAAHRLTAVSSNDGQDQRWESSSSVNLRGSGATKAGPSSGTSTTVGWTDLEAVTSVNASWAMVGVGIKAAPYPKSVDLTGPSSLLAGEVGTYSVTLKDGEGETIEATSNTNFSLAGSGGIFYADSNATAPITAVSISSGSSGRTFYFRRNSAGSTSLVASRTSGHSVGADTLGVTISAAAGSVAETEMSASPTSLVADGTSTSTVSVTVKDAYGNTRTAGGDTVALSTTLGTLGSVTYAGSGVYTAEFTAGTAAGSASVTGTLNGSSLEAAATITLVAGSASADETEIEAAPASITADGTSTSTVTVTVKDAYGNTRTAGGDTVSLSTTLGTLGSVTYAGSGVYTAELTAGTASGTATISGMVNGHDIDQTAQVTLVAGAAVGAMSLLEADDLTLVADGVDSTTLRVTVRDAHGNVRTAGGDTVTFQATAGTVGTVTYAGAGIYEATLTAAPMSGPSWISAWVGSDSIPGTEVLFTKVPGPSHTESWIEIVGETPVAAGESVEIRIHLNQGKGHPWTGALKDVELSTTMGTLSPLQDLGNGVWSALFTATEVGTAWLELTIKGHRAGDLTRVDVVTTAGHHLVILAPALPVTLEAGQILAPALTIELQDAFGNRVLDFNGEITVETWGTDIGRPRVQGTTTRTASAGVVEFDDLWFDGTGIQRQLVARAEGVGSARSNYITILPQAEEQEVEIEVEASNETPAPGEAVTYTVAVTNQGTGAATSLRLDFDVGDRSAVQSITVSHGEYDEVAGVWHIGALAEGEVATMTIAVIILDIDGEG